MKNLNQKIWYVLIIIFSFLLFSINSNVHEEGLDEGTCSMPCMSSKKHSTKGLNIIQDSLELIKGIQLYMKADSLSLIGQHEVSIKIAEEAASIFERIGVWDNYVNVVGLVARNYIQLGSFDKVEQLNRKMVTIIAEKELPDDINIQVYFLSGSVNHEKGHFRKAFDDFGVVLNILLRDKPLNSLTGFSKTDSIVELNRKLGLGHTYNYAAFSLLALGEFDKGLDYFKKARYYYSAIGDQASVFSNYINIGTAYLNKGMISEAIFSFEQLVIDGKGEDRNIALLAIAYNNLAHAYELKKDYIQQANYIEALKELFTKPGIELLQTLTGVPLGIGELTMLSKEALNQARRGSFENASRSTDAVLDLINDTEEYASLLTVVYNDIGDVFYLSSQPEKALQNYQKGLKILDPSLIVADYFDDPKLKNILHKLQGISLLESKAKVMVELSQSEVITTKLQYLKGALSTIELSLNLFESIQRNLVQASNDNVSKEGSLLDLEKRYVSLFDLNMEIVYALFQMTKEAKYKEMAFSISEKSKSFILRQALSQIEQLKDFPIEKREEFQKLEAALFFFDKEIIKAERANNIVKKEALELQRINNKERYQQIALSLKNNPETASFYKDYFEAHTLSVEAVQKMLEGQPGKVILEIYESSDKIYTFLISSEKVEINQQDKPENWAAQIEKLRELNLDLNLIANKKLIAGYLQINKELIEILLSSEIIKAAGNIDQLVVIPHGESHNINFNILLRSFDMPVFHEIEYLAYPVADCSTFDYLVHHYAISYASSAAIMLNDLEKRKVKQSFDYSLMGFAPDYSYRNKSALENGEKPVDVLPNEISPILYLFDEDRFKILDGIHADEASFRELVETYSANILHVSAHGEIDDGGLLLSKIILGKSQKNTTVYDDDLQIAELYNLRILTELAILSVCSAADGKLFGNAGKISLARGFAYANCPGIIMSFWDLETKSNQQIIQNLYVQLVENRQSVDRSLQMAQLNYLKDKQLTWTESEANTTREKESILEAMHPFFWAGLVPVGRTAPLTIEGETVNAN
jgi:CHAT domain-containing protein